MEKESVQESVKWEHIYVDIEDIRPVDNIRPIDWEIVEEIASSIKQTGQLQECIGDIDEEGIRLLAGRHRYEAVNLLAEIGYSIPLYMRVANRRLTEEEILSIQMSENLHNKMTAAQEASIIYKFWQKSCEIYGVENISIKGIASKVGRSPRKVSEAVKYIEGVSPKVQELVDGGNLSYSCALLIADLHSNGDEYWGKQVRVALQIVSKGFNSIEAKKYIERLNQEEKFEGPLFDNEMWENIKKNGHLVSIKNDADREGRKAAGWFVRMISTISKLDNPEKAQLSEGIGKAIGELDISLDEFINKLNTYSPRNGEKISRYFNSN